MRKLFAILLATALMTGGVALAGSSLSTRPSAAFPAGSPATTNNDDSCDIGTFPAATLLLPYFEVDYRSPQTTAQTALFTVVNVTRLPQIARVTVWSDWAFPVVSFSVFLTGYDVQAINMYDIIARGIIAPTGGTSNLTTPGSLSAANSANLNFAASASESCAHLPGQIPASLLADIQNGLSTGLLSSCGNTQIGGAHNNAAGYVTIDVLSTCSTTLPTSSSYYTAEILFDNALTGDYEQINPNPQTGNYAGGNPMVHIRAVPEGGSAGSIPGTNLPYTFYDRYTNQAGPGIPRTVDRRQPLPSAFAARYIQGGTGAFNTNYKIWREGVTGAGASCNQYSQNSSITPSEIVRFDEHEFPMLALAPDPDPVQRYWMPPALARSTSSQTFPFMFSPSGDVGGWMYMNLNSGGSLLYSSARSGFSGGLTTVGARPSQNALIVSMFAEGRYSVDFDATALGNGCSPGALPTRPDQGQRIGPAGGAPVCPPQVVCTPGASYGGTNVTP